MINWAYLAGFLDGDGWITSSKNKHCSTIRFYVGLTQKSTSKEEMYEILNYLLTNGINANLYYRCVRGSIDKDTEMINIYIGGMSSILILLNHLLPFLLFKKKKAEDCIKYLSDRKLKQGKWIVGNNTKKYWTPDELKILSMKLSDGFRPSAIANILGRSSQSVSQKLSKMRKKCTPLPCHGDVIIEYLEGLE